MCSGIHHKSPSKTPSFLIRTVYQAYLTNVNSCEPITIIRQFWSPQRTKPNSLGNSWVIVCPVSPSKICLPDASPFSLLFHVQGSTLTLSFLTLHSCQGYCLVALIPKLPNFCDSHISFSSSQSAPNWTCGPECIWITVNSKWTNEHIVSMAYTRLSDPQAQCSPKTRPWWAAMLSS